MRHYAYIIALMLTVIALDGFSQRYPERRMVRKGNKFYERKNYVEAEVNYARANAKVPSYEGMFNHADAIYKQDRYEDALKGYQALLADSTNAYTPQTHYNIGNSFYKLNKLKEAEEAYKASLRLNPNDQQAKFNLAYVQKKLEDQKNNQNQNQNQDQNKDNKDQKKDQDKNKDQNKDQNKGKNKPDQQQGQKPATMSKEEAEQMLKAMEAGEENARKKVDDEKKQGAVVRSGKNW